MSVIDEYLKKYDETQKNELERIIQLTRDAFIGGTEIFPFQWLYPVTFLIYVLFMAIYYSKNKNKQSLTLFYLLALWILIPWIVMSTYNGEITDYYFSISRDVFIVSLSYLIFILYMQKLLIIKLIIITLGLFYAYYNTELFFKGNNGNFLSVEQNVRQTIKHNEVIPYDSHDPNYYLQYVYLRDKKLGIKY